MTDRHDTDRPTRRYVTLTVPLPHPGPRASWPERRPDPDGWEYAGPGARWAAEADDLVAEHKADGWHVIDFGTTDPGESTVAALADRFGAATLITSAPHPTPGRTFRVAVRDRPLLINHHVPMPDGTEQVIPARCRFRLGR